MLYTLFIVIAEKLFAAVFTDNLSDGNFCPSRYRSFMHKPLTVQVPMNTVNYKLVNLITLSFY